MDSSCIAMLLQNADICSIVPKHYASRRIGNNVKNSLTANESSASKAKQEEFETQTIRSWRNNTRA